MSLDHTVLGLIPARGGSSRCPGKNTRPLAGVPLVVRAIRSAQESGICADIIVSTDDDETKRLARREGVRVHHRKAGHAVWDAPDVWWVRDVIDGRREDVVAILRPTSPFRSASMIRRGFAAFVHSGAHSLRAVRPVTEPPGKMWRVLSALRMEPVLEGQHRDGTPWHSSPTQTLPEVMLQSGGLEMAWRWAIEQTGSISGVTVCPFPVNPVEAVDINTEADFALAERMMRARDAGERMAILRGVAA